MDGDLSDDAWRHATRVDKWYETNPGDNIEPPVRSVGMIAYDDKFFYAAFEFDDPRHRRSARRTATATTCRPSPTTVG